MRWKKEKKLQRTSGVESQGKIFWMEELSECGVIAQGKGI